MVKLKMKIKEDIEAKAVWLYEKKGIVNFLKAVLSDGSLSMIIYRGMSYFSKRKITRIFAYILEKLNSVICGCVIGIDAEFGSRFIILHSEGIVINKSVRGGIDIIIESGVVIGSEKRVCPILGDKIYIGSGAKIFGNIQIGNNVRIGANAVVNKSVPDNATVGGVPAVVLSLRGHISS